MTYYKIKNKKTGQFCSGSEDFAFDNEGKLFTSMYYLDRYVVQVKLLHPEFNSCKDDIEVVECEIVPQKTVQYNFSLT